MIRFMFALFAAAGVLSAQTENPLSAEAKQAYNNVKNNLLKAADKMPEDGYGFKATPDVRPFGQVIAHVADAQTRNCSAAAGTPKTGDAASKTAKSDLVAALKDSFAICDAAFDALTDANATETIKTGRGQRTRLGLLTGNTTHDNEMYGTIAVYLRLKGIVPPSSDRR